MPAVHCGVFRFEAQLDDFAKEFAGGIAILKFAADPRKAIPAPNGAVVGFAEAVDATGASEMMSDVFRRVVCFAKNVYSELGRFKPQRIFRRSSIDDNQLPEDVLENMDQCTLQGDSLEASVKTRIGTSLLVLVVLLGCSSGPPPQAFRLPSGRTIKVLGMGPIRIASGETGLMLNYQTDLKITDLDRLRAEVDDIWPTFQVDAEKAQVSFAVISANEVPEGMIIKQNRKYNFVFQKSSDGAWHSVTKNETKP